MQHAGIRPGRDNRIKREFAALASVFVRQLRFDFGFIDARPHELQQPVKSVIRDRHRFPQSLQLRLAFHAAQLLHDATQAMIMVQRIAFDARPNEPIVARGHIDGRAIMLVRIQIDVIDLAHQLVPNALELRKPFDVLDARKLLTFFLGKLLPLPSF